MVKYLAKANNDVLSFCGCDTPLAAPPGQFDCPWCGCGWMISCFDCGKAFVYAKVVELDAQYETIVRQSLERSGYKDLNDDDVRHDAECLRVVLSDLEVGSTVVYFDGRFFPLEAGPIEFEGDYATHRLAELPHYSDLLEPERLKRTLGDPRYWLERERANRFDES